MGKAIAAVPVPRPDPQPPGASTAPLLTTFPGDTTMATLEQVEAFARGG